MTNAGGENTDKCRAEFAARMANGEEFELGGYIIKFDASRLSGYISPFVTIRGVSTLSLEKSWQYMDEWNLAPDWRDELSPENPRWCKVWDDDDKKEVMFARLDEYCQGDEYPYGSIGINRWENAEPLDDKLAAWLDNAL